jgi:hypothetical protein
MTVLTVKAEWEPSDLIDPDESATFAEVRVCVDATPVSRFLDPTSNQQKVVEGPRVPIIDLVTGLAANWWTLLYEPEKQEGNQIFQARHRLDAMMPGSLFPPIALWSGGESLMASVLEPDERFQRYQYVRTNTPPSWTLDRELTQDGLAALIGAAVSQLDRHKAPGAALRDAWDRVLVSRADEDEAAWCMAAGRLGIDPYRLDGPDITSLSAGLGDDLFRDLCEAVESDEISRSVKWARESIRRLQSAPAVSVRPFGGAPPPDYSHPAWRDGVEAARLVRRRGGLPLDPKKTVQTLLEGALTDRSSGLQEAPPAIEGLAKRSDHMVKIAVSAPGTAGKRFALCRGAYLAWVGGQHADIAITAAGTRRQQASRAFAAEIVAPVELLQERASPHGLTQAIVDRIASEWQCNPRTIIYQAENHRVPLRGIGSGVRSYAWN